MANHMETYIRVKNGNKEVTDKLKEIFTPLKNDHQVDAQYLVSRLYNKPLDEEYGWNISDVGSKWMYSEFHLDGDDLDYMELTLTSAWSVPIPFLEKLSEVLYTIKEDCYIIGKYEDESYSPIGSFLFSKYWNNIEDCDIEVDSYRLSEDDDYREEVYELTNKLQDKLEELYKLDNQK